MGGGGGDLCMWVLRHCTCQMYCLSQLAVKSIVKNKQKTFLARNLCAAAQVGHGEGQAWPAPLAAGQPRPQVPLPGLPAVPPAPPGDHPVPAGVAAEAACASGRGGGTAVPDGASHGLAGPGQANADHA